MIIASFRVVQRTLTRETLLSDTSNKVTFFTFHNPVIYRHRQLLGLVRGIISNNGPNTHIDEDPVVTIPDGQITKNKTETKKKPRKKKVKTLLTKTLDVESFLEASRLKKSSTNSTVFMGYLYEVTVLEYLKKHFHVSNIFHQGGKDDKGIDIRANWDLNTFKRMIDEKTELIQALEEEGEGNSEGDNKKEAKEITKSSGLEIVNGTKRVKPLALRKNVTESLNVKLFVQCKCWTTSKIDAKMVREINGTYSSMVSNQSANIVFFMIFTPTGFTRQGRIDFDSSPIPLIYVNFSKSELKFPSIKTKKLEYNPSAYDIKNYELGGFQSVYCNPTAQALLKGLNWPEIFSKTKLKEF